MGLFVSRGFALSPIHKLQDGLNSLMFAFSLKKFSLFKFKKGLDLYSCLKPYDFDHHSRNRV